MSAGGTKVVYIKKKGKHGGHHGGAWKVAYADFVTAMMALFIVLWLLTQTDTASKERIAQYFRTGTLPGGTMVHGQSAGSNPPMAINIFPTAEAARVRKQAEETKTLRQLADAVAAATGQGNGEGKSDEKSENEGVEDVSDIADHVAVKLVNEGALIELVEGGDNFLFSVSSSSLKSGAVALLEKLAPILAKVPNKIEIHGHTDARRFEKKNGQDNWDLSFERANQARQVLEAHGLPKGRISAVLAHADSSPYNAKDPYAPENRRLSILVVRQGYEATRAGNPKNPPAFDPMKGPKDPPEGERRFGPTGMELPPDPKEDDGQPKPAAEPARDPHGAAPANAAEPAPDSHGAAPANHGEPAPDAHGGAPANHAAEPAHDPHAATPAANTAEPTRDAHAATPAAGPAEPARDAHATTPAAHAAEPAHDAHAAIPAATAAPAAEAKPPAPAPAAADASAKPEPLPAPGKPATPRAKPTTRKPRKGSAIPARVAASIHGSTKKPAPKRETTHP